MLASARAHGHLKCFSPGKVAMGREQREGEFHWRRFVTWLLTPREAKHRATVQVAARQTGSWSTDGGTQRHRLTIFKDVPLS